MSIHEATQRVADCMDKILSNFKSGSKITVLVRAPGKPNADFCLTDDDLDEVIAMVRRRKGEAPPQTNVDAPDAFELRYREGFEDGEKHAADELALAQSYRDTYKGILDELQERGLTPGTIDIIKERRRQIAAEGWTPEHDDEHTDGSLALAAGSYCESAARPKILARKPGGAFAIPKLWPQSWSRDWWKPKSPREDLVRAGALIIAEIERIDRAATGVEKP